MKRRRKTSAEVEGRRLLSEPEVGGVGAAAGASGEDAAAGLAGMALLWVAVPPGCCWGGGDGFSLVGGGGRASPPAQQHNKNKQKPAHALVHLSALASIKQRTRKVKAESSRNRAGAREFVRAGSLWRGAGGGGAMTGTGTVAGGDGAACKRTGEVNGVSPKLCDNS